MGKLIDMTNKRFGRIVVLSKSIETNNSGSVKWLCQCDCGNKKIITGTLLRNGESQSCGCFFIDVARNKGKAKKIHGLTKSRIYRIWSNMKQRCNNPKNEKYHLYGQAGIKVCKEWNDSFHLFYKDMGECPENMTIDRIDNTKGYFKENCRWATQKQQQNNRSNNLLLVINSETMTMQMACDKYQKNSDKVQQRLKRGWSVEEAFDMVKRSCKK